MNELPIGALFGALALLIVLSAFFSGSETGMMALNRYRLRHLSKQGHRGARRASRLLERPDRLIGLILLGNNFVNILASAIATVIALRVLGEAGIAVATGLLTIVVLVFAEVAPKTVAALNPERVAFPASIVLIPLLKLLYPLVWAVNGVSNGLLWALRAQPSGADSQQLSSEELRTVVNEAGAMISRRYRRMLVSVLDLEKATVEDIMIPRHEVQGIDLEDRPEIIVEQLANSQHTRLPVFNGDIDNIVGILHLRKIIGPLRRDELTKEVVVAAARDPYFIPAGTPLSTQLMNFQRQHRRVGLVVNEYGDIQGLVTLEDILEEIVGEFTSDPATLRSEVHPQPDGTYLVDAAAYVRDLNRSMHWELPTDGPKTLNGVIIEYMETIPEPGTSLLVAGYPVEIVQTSGSAVKMVRINPAMRRPRRPPQQEI